MAGAAGAMIVASRFSMKNAPATRTARAREKPGDPGRDPAGGGDVTRTPCQERPAGTGRTMVAPGSGLSRAEHLSPGPAPTQGGTDGSVRRRTAPTGRDRPWPDHRGSVVRAADHA